MVRDAFVVAAISDSIERGFDEFFEWLPKLVGFLVVLLIGWIVARIVAGIVERVSRGAGLDRTLLQGTGGNWVSKVTSAPSKLLGSIAFWLLFLGALSIALDVLGIAALEELVASVWAYLPNVLAALLIFIVAGAIAAGASAFASRFMGDTPTGRIVSTAAPILVMTIATFMILDQLRIAETIVTITYAGLIGAIALGAALAFGLGGRDAAARLLEGAVARSEGAVAQAKQDFKQGADRARTEVEERRDDLDADDPTVTRPA
jgi:Conserved TM helix